MLHRFHHASKARHTAASFARTLFDTVFIRNVSYPDHYCWYVLAGTMDIVLTWIVLNQGGREVNGIANAALELLGGWGLIGLKFLTVLVVIAICEYVGNRRQEWGRNLAMGAVAVSCVPSVVAVAQLVPFMAGAPE